jgi:hypothetical protein
VVGSSKTRLGLAGNVGDGFSKPSERFFNGDRFVRGCRVGSLPLAVVIANMDFDFSSCHRRSLPVDLNELPRLIHFTVALLLSGCLPPVNSFSSPFFGLLL